MRKFLLLTVSMLLFSALLFAQNRTITGKITDQNGGGIPNASVTVKGTSVGTTTAADGSFTLPVASGAKTIVVSSIGYQSQELSIGSKTSFSVGLTSTSSDMNEVVVVAYGTAKKGEITSASTQISYDKFKNRPITNISSALEGAGPGIQVTSANGQPGSGQSIRIRGFGSINASNDPLYVLDGVVYSGGLSNLNMDDIESITALKDAASTALYGSRGANGVIIITTKRGKKNRNQLSFKVTQGAVSRGVPEYDRVNALQYYPLMWQSLRNSLQYGSGQTEAIASQNATNGIKAQLGYNPFGNIANNDIVRTDGTLNPTAQLLWIDDLDWAKNLERTGRRKEYSLNYNGGNDKTDYYASFGYLSESGFVIKSKQDKFLGRLNVNAQPLNWFKTGINISGTVTNSDLANDGSSTGYINPFFFARNIGPIYPVYAHNQTTGEYLMDASGNRFYDFGNFGGNAALGIPNRPSGASPGRHVTAETELNQNFYKRNVLSARTYGDIMFYKDLKFTTNISIDITNLYSSTYDNNIIGDGAPAGRASKASELTRSYTFNQLLNYAKAIRQHNFSVLLGHENYDLSIESSSASRQGQVVAGNYELDNFTTTNSVSSSVDKHRIESYFSRVNYDFDGRYILSGSIRRDGNSRFKRDFRWDNFWSVGAAWRIDREKFLTPVTWVNALKLRTSYGKVGNDAGIGYYPYQGLYSLGFNNNQEPGIRQSSLPNDSITWEGQKTFDAALEFSVLKNRIFGTVEYYNRNTDDLIFGVQFPLSFGGYVLNKNIGSMKNTGWELNLGGDIVRKKDINWRLELNVSTVKNTITKMPGNQPEIISGTKKLAVGHSLYDYWLRDWEGVDPIDGSALYRATSYVAANSRVRGKDDTVSTSQNNAKFDYVGTAIPDYFGSIQNTVTFKRFEFSALLSYSLGGKTYDGSYAALMHAGTYGAALHTDALKAWKQPGEVTDVPRLDNSKTGVFDVASSRWLIDASYLNIRSVGLSYNMPAGWLTRIHASSARIYVNGENLYLFSRRKGMNVQQSFTGVTSNTYVPAKVLTVGLNLNF